MTPDQLVEIMQAPRPRCLLYYPHLVEGMGLYGIDSLQQRACFLATIGHESGGFKYTREVWGPTPAQERYEGRADLGNTQPGDGSRFRGRGLIQITGRANVAAASLALGQDYLAEPKQLERPRDAALSACWWWSAHGCNELAEQPEPLNMRAVTKRVNGGLNGYADRLNYYHRAMKALRPNFDNVQAGVDTTAPIPPPRAA